MVDHVVWISGTRGPIDRGWKPRGQELAQTCSLAFLAALGYHLPTGHKIPVAWFPLISTGPVMCVLTNQGPVGASIEHINA